MQDFIGSLVVKMVQLAVPPPPPSLIDTLWASASGAIKDGASFVTPLIVSRTTSLGFGLWGARTGLERAIIYGGPISYAMWKHRSVVSEAFGNFSEVGWRGIFRKLKTIPAPGTMDVTRMESAREGSEEKFMTKPRFQATVGYFKDGAFMSLGGVVRMDNNVIVGPDHVLCELDPGSEYYHEKYVKGSQSHVSLKGKERISLDADLVMIVMTDKELSTIGISRGTIDYAGNHGIYVQIVGPLDKGTSGTLKNDPRNFGRVYYDKTTVAGYSGCAYTAGNHLIGLHQSGGVVNGGFSASYVWMLIKSHFRELPFAPVINESSEDWLMGQYRAGNKIRHKSHFDPEFVQVEVNGVYSAVRVTAMNATFGDQWRGTSELQQVRNRSYDDGIMESAEPSGEDRASKPCPGGSNSVATTGDSVPPHVQNLISEYQALSKHYRRSFRNSTQLVPRQQPTTSGQGRPGQLEN